MNRFAARTVALLLAFILCLGTLSGITMTADAATTVDYVTGNPSSKYTNVIKNWGNRGETATYLSQNAEAFYQDNNTSYAELSAFSGATSTADVPSSELYQELQRLMESNHKKITSYDDTKALYAYTDCENSGDPRTISSFYSGTPIGPDWDGSWNREHTWPNSKGGSGSNENDIMMLRPTASSENSSRGNTAYGESANFYDPNSRSNGTYNLHGDVARIFLYVYVRWGVLEHAWGSDGVMESRDVLLKWMEEDPVDTWELGRNDSVESITGTRNVFVDYPELGFLLFNAEVPAITTPSGEAGNTSTYTITAQSNNAAYGTVSTNGRTITAVPAKGYEVAGYTVVSGTATVTRNGNQFTVSATSDCTVRINFQARTAVSVSFLQNGTTTGTQSAYVGDVITLPAASVTVPAEYTFKGWVTSQQNESTTMPTFYSAGSSYTVEGATSFYALYSRTDESGSETSSIFKLHSGEVTEGDYLIVYDSAAMKAGIRSGSSTARLDFTTVTPIDDCVNSPDATLIWHIGFVSGNICTLYNESTNSYAVSTGTKNQAELSTTENDYSTWTVSGSETYEFVNQYNSANGVNANLRKNTTYGFACYAAGTGGRLTLYKAASGTVYYTTNAKACEHANTVNVAEQPATSTESGFTAGVYCNDCKSFISGHEVIGALGETYTVSFAVPNGAAAIEKQACNTNSGITLPTPDVPTGDHSYTFAGWAAQSVTDTTEKPVLLKAGSNYVAQADTTLYAVYTYNVGGTGSAKWVLVTDASTLTAGDKLVIACNSKGKVAGNLSGAYMLDPGATFSGDNSTISALPDTAAILTLGGTSGAWTLANSDGQLLGATTVKKLAWGSGTTTWDITVASGNATIQNGTSTYGRFLYNVNSPRFTTYTSAANVSMLLPQLYVQEGSAGTTYYTSLDGAVKPTLFNISGVSMSLGNSLAMYYYVPAANVTSSCYAQITRGGIEEEVSFAKWTKDTVEGVEYYLIPFNGIAAKEMTDELTCVVYNGDGAAISNPKTSSVEIYALKQLAATTDANLQRVLVDMLNYGAAAQNEFSYKTTVLANAKLTDTQKGWGTGDIDISALHVEPVKGKGWKGCSLILESNIQLAVFFDNAVVTKDMTAKISYTDHYGDLIEYEIPGSAFENYEGTTMLYVSVETLAAADLETVVSIDIMSGETLVSHNQCSMAQYCTTVGTNPMVEALVRYCKAANTYFHP